MLQVDSRIRFYPLINYLSERGISTLDHLQEIHFTIDGGKTQKALAFKNDNGDYEVRNPFFKGFIGDKKTITSIGLQTNKPIAVFEGFFDFLSFLSELGKRPSPAGYIILNSTNLKEQALAKILETNSSKVYLFLDNDEIGDRTTSYFLEMIPAKTIDKRDHFGGAEDYNDYWVKKQQGIN